MSNDPYVIVGAGHAGRRAAETLRQRDAQCRIVMLGEEPDHPYDRPALSKEALLAQAGEQKLFVRDAVWYRENDVDVRLNVRVEGIDRQRHAVRLSGGEWLPYRRLLLATGSRVRRYPGTVDPGVKLHYVRTLADTRTLRDSLAEGRRVVILGGGFIGLEVAATARARGCKVHLIETAPSLLLRSMPAVVGTFVGALHETHGVTVSLATTVVRIRAAEDGSTVVETSQGDVMADVVVVGIGVVPNVELAAAADLAVDNGIVVDAGCRTADPDIYAAGEVSNQFNAFTGKRMRIESWQIAENQPAVAAANMMGGDETYGEIPWLWSDQYDCNIQTLGSFDLAAELVTRGDPASGAFTVFGLQAEGADKAFAKIVAVAAINSGRDIAVCRRLMQGEKRVAAAVLRDSETVLRKLL